MWRQWTSCGLVEFIAQSHGLTEETSQHILPFGHHLQTAFQHLEVRLALCGVLVPVGLDLETTQAFVDTGNATDLVEESMFCLRLAVAQGIQALLLNEACHGASRLRVGLHCFSQVFQTINVLSDATLEDSLANVLHQQLGRSSGGSAPAVVHAIARQEEASAPNGAIIQQTLSQHTEDGLRHLPGTMTWSTAPAAAGISRRGMNAGST
mmetsp:Transcript_69475/g.109597  ORF Transcript_69475/g.109597 Transcript_69475/m.109597 type:complete len:209 (-) Transcript_69475:688-1314(-)